MSGQERWVPFGFGSSGRSTGGDRDWIVLGAAVLIGLHLLLYLALQARLGAVSAVLWYVGPSLLAAGAVALLVAALVSSIRRRLTWSQRSIARLALLSALAAAPGLYRIYPSSHDGQPSATKFRLPLTGPVTIAWGGPGPDVNDHVVAPDQRWGYDLLLTSGGRSFEGRGRSLTDYFAYGREVLAPADGVVHTVHDGEPDVAIDGSAHGDDLGNFVALRTAPEEFLYIAHLQPGSITVTPGQRVTAGEPIGRVGNSGKSTEPHVHLHLQDSPHRHVGNGVPFYFSDYCARAVHVARGMPEGGVRHGRWTGAVVTHDSTGRCRALEQP
jgi:murein DD-endopeptidase MepM/ murein hydrolase activator NlpD